MGCSRLTSGASARRWQRAGATTKAWSETRSISTPTLCTLDKTNCAGAPPERLNLDDHRYGFLNVFGDWLYYVSYAAALGSRAIHRVRPDGSEEERLNDTEAIMINVVGDQIFFINNADDRRLYRINIDGSQEKCLDAQPYVTSIHVFDDLVFCPFSLDEKFTPAKMFTIQTDGSGHRELF
jgi:hypothetical protein